MLYQKNSNVPPLERILEIGNIELILLEAYINTNSEIVERGLRSIRFSVALLASPLPYYIGNEGFRRQLLMCLGPISVFLFSAVPYSSVRRHLAPEIISRG